MITTFILKIIVLLFSLIGALLPEWRLPDYILNSFSSGMDHVLFFNNYLPIVAGFKIFILILSFEVTLILARIIFGVISVVRGGGKIEV